MNGHLARLQERYRILGLCAAEIEAAYERLRRVFESGGTLFVCGNGGSAADAEHIVGELMKGFLLPRPLAGPVRDQLRGIAGEDLGAVLQGALPAIALTCHGALSTAVANDTRGDMAFAQQVYGLGRAGDALLAISTSGNSANVLHAVHVAHLKGMTTLALTGQEGGKLSGSVDVAIRVPASSVMEVQELHLPVYHALCAALEACFFP